MIKLSIFWNFSLGILMQIGWKPGVGDPTLMGWLTVFIYLLVAIACWLRSRTAVSTPQPLFQRRFWRSLAMIVLLLGINKQLNFLSLFTSLGRRLAWQQQWWQERRSLQLGLVEFVISVIVTLIGISLWRLRHLPGRYMLASITILLLSGFVLIRATSLHAVDYYLFTSFAGVRLNWVFELGLLLLLFLTAVFPINFHSPHDPAPKQVL